MFNDVPQSNITVRVTCTNRRCRHTWDAPTAIQQSNYFILPSCPNPSCQLVHLCCTYCQCILSKRRRGLMLQHIAEDHANDTIQPNDSIHSASDVDLIFDIDNNDDDDIDIGSNINNLSIDMSLMSIDEVGSDDNDDVGEILDSDDRTWTNDMIDDDESDATTDYVMEEQIRSEDIPPCDTYQYQSSEEGQTDPNKMNMHDFSYMKGAHNRMFYMQEHNICNGGIRGLAHRAASRMNSSEGHVGFKEADILLDISENLFSKSKSDQMKHLNTLKKVFSLFPHSEPQSSVNIPLEIKAANDVCLENKYAIVKNLPHRLY